MPNDRLTDEPAAQPPVLVMMGVSGCGKSTVAGLVAGRLGWELQEGDDLHPESNVAKMAAGIPLTDEDRWPWLDLIAGWIADHVKAGAPGVVTCSALRRVYRDRLRGDHSIGDHVMFVHLAGTRDTIGPRMAARANHYMPPALLDSQLNTLEPIEADEKSLVVSIGRTPGELADEVITRLGLEVWAR